MNNHRQLVCLALQERDLLITDIAGLDLTLNFHPALMRATAVSDTPLGAD